MADITSNSLLNILNVQEKDRLILVKEHDMADSNFIITHLMKQILHNEKNKICFVIMHNTVGHYHNVGKKLGYDLLAKVKSGAVKVIEPMTSIFEELTDNRYNLYINKNKNKVVCALDATIKANIDELSKTDGTIYLIIDDLSHLYDIGVETGTILQYMGIVASETYGDNVNMLINMHIGDENDYKVSTALEYYADINIDVAPLKTGRSHDVTGVIRLDTNDGTRNIYHYKALDKEIRTFRPGEALIYR